MESLITNIVGYTATLVGTLIMVPQVIKSLRTKKVDDVASMMLILYFLNCILWAAYGVLISSVPIMLCNFIALGISILQIGIKMKYSRKSNKQIS